MKIFKTISFVYIINKPHLSLNYNAIGEIYENTLWSLEPEIEDFKKEPSQIRVREGSSSHGKTVSRKNLKVENRRHKLGMEKT